MNELRKKVIKQISEEIYDDILKLELAVKEKYNDDIKDIVAKIKSQEYEILDFSSLIKMIEFLSQYKSKYKKACKRLKYLD